jgi:signal transduction histidine kinase
LVDLSHWVMRNRWLILIGTGVVGLVVIANAAGEVGFGFSGTPLLITAATAVYAAAAITFLVWATAPAGVIVALLLVMGAAASAIHNGDPGGPVVGLFLVMAFAPLRLELRTAAAVAVAAALTFNLQQAATAPNPVVFITVTNGGAAFFFAMGWLLRREQEQRVQLEATHDAERTAATLTERARLAREIHDVLAHSLSGLALQLEAARILARTTRADARMVAAIERAHELARGGLVDVRHAMSALHGDAIPGPEQLPALIDEHRRLTDSACQLVVDGEAFELSQDARLAVYRTTQEALSNIRKHTTGQTAVVHLSWTNEGAQLTIENTGTATTPGADRHATGYGLSGLAERADLLGAHLTAQPTPEGFRVALAIPAHT